MRCLLSGLFLVFFLTGCAHLNNHFDRVPAKSKRQLRLVTYNLNWGKKEWHHGKPTESVKAIQSLQPDIILLQEATEKWQDYLRPALHHHYPYRHYLLDDSATGMAVLSKYPVSHMELLPVKYGRHFAQLFQVQTPKGNIQMMNVHLLPPLTKGDGLGLFAHALWTTGSLRRYEMAYFYDFITPNMPTIIAGDFNESHYGAAGQLLYSHGFQNALLVQNDNAATWHWPVLGIFRLTRRIDHIYYNKALCLKKLFILHEGSSDHFPIMGDFTFQAPSCIHL